jgi:Flp pilus assembly pilin Flp
MISIHRFLKDEAGTVQIEYLLVASLVALTLAGSLEVMGNWLSASFGKVASDLTDSIS